MAGWVALTLLVGAVVAVVVVQNTLLDGPSGQPSGTPEAGSTPTTEFVPMFMLHANCEEGSMADCDRLYEYMQEHPDDANAIAQNLVETCAGAGTGGHQGTCEEDFGPRVTVTTAPMPGSG